MALYSQPLASVASSKTFMNTVDSQDSLYSHKTVDGYRRNKPNYYYLNEYIHNNSAGDVNQLLKKKILIAIYYFYQLTEKQIFVVIYFQYKMIKQQLIKVIDGIYHHQFIHWLFFQLKLMLANPANIAKMPTRTTKLICEHVLITANIEVVI